MPVHGTKSGAEESRQVEPRPQDDIVPELAYQMNLVLAFVEFQASRQLEGFV